MICISFQANGDSIVRALVDIPDTQIEEISMVCAAEGVSRAELIRRAITEYIANSKCHNVDAFGLWKDADSPKDGLIYQEELRGEW
jgi:hypothetical protein